MRQFKPLTSLRLLLALWVLCRHWIHRYGADGAYFDLGFTSMSKARILAGCVLAALAMVEASSPEHLSLSGGVARLLPEFMLGALLCRLSEAMPDYDGCVLDAAILLLVCAIAVWLAVDTLFVAGAAGLIF